MMIDKPPFELHHGPVDSPLRHVEYCIYQGRQLGKTHKLMMSIPNRPIVIVVHSQQMGREIKHMLQEHRPDYDIKNIMFISYDKRGYYLDDLRERLRGLRGGRPIFFDNCVLDMLQLDYVEGINNMFGAVNRV